MGQVCESWAGRCCSSSDCCGEMQSFLPAGAVAWSKLRNKGQKLCFVWSYVSYRSWPETLRINLTPCHIVKHFPTLCAAYYIRPHTLLNIVIYIANLSGGDSSSNKLLISQGLGKERWKKILPCENSSNIKKIIVLQCHPQELIIYFSAELCGQVSKVNFNFKCL